MRALVSYAFTKVVPFVLRTRSHFSGCNLSSAMRGGSEISGRGEGRSVPRAGCGGVGAWRRRLRSGPGAGH